MGILIALGSFFAGIGFGIFYDVTAKRAGFPGGAARLLETQHELLVAVKDGNI